MKRIENSTSRQVTFSKRRNGLLKKAYELSVLCDAEVALIIFAQSGRVSEFSSSADMQKTIQRYQKSSKEPVEMSTEMEQHMQHLKRETATMANKIKHIEVSKRKLLGQCLGACSLEELDGISSQLEQSLHNIRVKKV